MSSTTGSPSNVLGTGVASTGSAGGAGGGGIMMVPFALTATGSGASYWSGIASAMARAGLGRCWDRDACGREQDRASTLGARLGRVQRCRFVSVATTDAVMRRQPYPSGVANLLRAQTPCQRWRQSAARANAMPAVLTTRCAPSDLHSLFCVVAVGYVPFDVPTLWRHHLCGLVGLAKMKK